MAMPSDIDARRFYRVAYQRFEDGKALLEINRPRAAIYLAGYAIECILKALILVSTPANQRSNELALFRGSSAHNIDRLRERLVPRINRLPVGENKVISFVGSWSTDLRYEPGPGNYEDADEFLKAANLILAWADGRM